MVVAGRISDRYGRTATSSVILLMGAAGSLTFGWLLNAPLWLLIAVGVIYGTIVATESPVLSTAVTELAPAGRLGAAQASQAFLGHSTSALSPIAFGAILDIASGVKSWGLAFSSFGVISLMGAAFMQALRRRDESLLLAGGKR